MFMQKDFAEISVSAAETDHMMHEKAIQEAQHILQHNEKNIYHNIIKLH